MDQGEKLAHLRKEKGLTLSALAELAGTRPRFIWDLEHGKSPSIVVASKLARVLDVPLELIWIKSDKQKRCKGLKVAAEPKKVCCRNVKIPRVDILNLSPRAFNALYSDNIKMIGKLVHYSEKELSDINGLGLVSIREIMEKSAVYQAT